ncbi:hypothetical protein [Streptomyces sp. NPDC055085]
MSDDDYGPRTEIVDEVRSGDHRRSLIALRDYVAHELEGNRCSKCAMSQLRTGDTAALVLRLQKLIEDIQALKDPKAESQSELQAIRQRDASNVRELRPTSGP